jgi:hypothetical protein
MSKLSENLAEEDIGSCCPAGNDEEYIACEYCGGEHLKDPWAEKDPFTKSEVEEDLNSSASSGETGVSEGEQESEYEGEEEIKA